MFIRCCIPLILVVASYADTIQPGWEGDAKLWRAEGGRLIGGSLTEKVQHNDFVATAKDYENFELTLMIKLTGTEGFINSGIQIRSQRVPKSSEMAGYQCDFGDPTWWGCIYDESRRNKVMAQSDMAKLGPAIKRNDWNEYTIRAEGPRIQTWINGVQGVDYTELDESIVQAGKIGIQVHGGGKALVEVKDIRITELPPSAPRLVFTPAAEPGPIRDLKAGPLTASEQLKTFTLPPGFQMELAVEEDIPQGFGKFITATWDAAGNLWTMTALEYPVDGNENAAAAEALYASKARDKVLVYTRDAKTNTYAKTPRVFADGLAIPLGLLPYKDGAIVQHGKEMVFLRDTDGDGKADKRETLLQGLGIDDSHLFLHGLTRGPGDWIYVAQGAFNHSKIQAGDGSTTACDFCKLARFTPDGKTFELVTAGLNNIWGFTIDREGYLWGQEANDLGYPVTPLKVGDNFPGIGEQRLKPYAPIRPKTVNAWKVGGTGLSGLALQEDPIWPEPYANSADDQKKAFYLANPITNRIQATVGRSTGPGEASWAQVYDFVRTSDPWFRPVHLSFGPDGSLYIVDWYNKIISHNEVPRNHPERDKQRGRIWRVRHEQQPRSVVPDIRGLSNDALVKFHPQNRWEAKTAWAEARDRKLPETIRWPQQDYRHELSQMSLEAIAESTPKADGSYAHDYRRYMIRAELEKRGEALPALLEQSGAKLNSEFVALALQSLGGKTAAVQLAKLLSRVARSASAEEFIQLAEYADEAEVKAAFVKAMVSPEALQTLLSISDRLKLANVQRELSSLAKLKLRSEETAALQAITAFKLTEFLPMLRDYASQPTVARLRALRSLGESDAKFYQAGFASADAAVAREALLGLALAPKLLLEKWSRLGLDQQTLALEAMAGTKEGAEAVLTSRLDLTGLDTPLLGKLEAAAGAENSAWQAFVKQHASLFRTVLQFPGKEESMGAEPIDLTGPFTVETWIKLAPKIGNADGILGAPGVLDANFYDSKFRLFVEGHDVAIARKPVSAEAWTHVAFTRDEQGIFQIFQNGELEATSTVRVTKPFLGLKIGWTGAPGGTEASMTEYRIWPKCRSAAEIRRDFDRSLHQVPALLPRLQGGAQVVQSLDVPAILTEAQASALDAKFLKFATLASQPGDLAKGKALSAVCTACHQIGEQGGKIGPNLTGVGSMSLDAILRNILTPNAAMEGGYRTFQVRLTDGVVKEGFLVKEDKDSITFRQPGLPDEHLAKSSITARRFLNRSLMPEGLLDALPEDSVRDLLSYLQSLK
jgi:putative membrane-bound dehydrogenase-like protein